MEKSKIDRMSCARRLSGAPDGNTVGNAKGGTANLQSMIIKPILLLKAIKNILGEIKKGKDVSANEYKLDKTFAETEEYSFKLTDKQKEEIKENIESMIEEVNDFLIRWNDRASNLYIITHDLSYVIENKQRKSDNKDLIRAINLITDVAKNIEKVSKLINKHLPSKEKKRLKVQDHHKYTNKLKHTLEHAKAVLELVEKRQYKMQKQTDPAIAKIENRKQAEKILLSKEYKEFEQNLKRLKEARELLNSLKK